ncbi:MAG TPA: hypothetical protein DEQ43_09740 [Nocardioides bacterium]|nr:hypothetical protein [Nocardioides sp.]
MFQPKSVLETITKTMKAKGAMTVDGLVAASGLTVHQVMQGMTLLRRDGVKIKAVRTSWGDSPCRWQLAN